MATVRSFCAHFCTGFLRYFLQLGFHDGRAGFVFHFLQGFWYRVLVDAKLMEAEVADRGPSRPSAE